MRVIEHRQRGPEVESLAFVLLQMLGRSVRVWKEVVGQNFEGASAGSYIVLPRPTNRPVA
jgi:hypothetical protein